MTVSVAAIDLGATSGRVIAGTVGPNMLAIRQVARFANGPTRTPDGIHWNALRLYSHALDGLGSAVRWDPAIESVGIDSWAVDYALLAGNRVLGEPFHYRDTRTGVGVDRVHAQVPHVDLYERNGLQFLPFNTLYQLAAEDPRGAIGIADSMLLIPDLLGFFLTGRKVAERTNASTTGLLGVRSREWDQDLISQLGMARELFPELVDAGQVIGPLLPHVSELTGLAAEVPVIAVGSHDTASAVVGTPMTEPGAAFLSCGTWGLVGMELEHPVLSAAAREANFTNEGGVDGRTRFLHNVMGLWLLTESIRTWEQAGHKVDLQRLLAEAEAIEGDVAVFNTNDPRLMTPGDMPARIAQVCSESNLPAPRTQAEFARSIIESLATAFADAVHRAAMLSRVHVSRIHLTGGGALNDLLCQRTADVSGMTVLAGPVEATAIGNVVIQGRACGAIEGSLESIRHLIHRSFEPRTFSPKGTAS